MMDMEEYLDYIDRWLDLHPDREPLSFEQYKAMAERWEREYSQAWENTPIDWGTIQELEYWLCV